MIDKDKIKEAIRLYLEGIGEDPDREGLIDTPDRVARMCEEIYGGYEMDAKENLSKTFDCPTGEMVLEKDITVHSVCEHHLLPFFGKVHIAYIPEGRIVGLSKLARTTEVFARRAQVQERLTEQIAEAIMKELKPKGAMVVIEAEHMCMSMRGIKKPGSKTMTYTVKGVFAEDRGLVDRVFSLIK